LKKALSLTEVLVSVALISVIIATLLNIKQNSLHLVDSLKIKSIHDSYFSLATLSNSKKDDSFFLDQYVTFENDELRKKIKEIQVETKNEKGEEIKYKLENIVLNISTSKQIYRYKDKSIGTIHEFSIK
jgi:hypothetical protein